MATYIYTAKRNNSETVKGQVNAQNQDEAVELISQLGLHPVSVQNKSEEEEAFSQGKTKKVKIKDLYVFSRQLSNLLRSGVSLLRGLTIIEEQTKEPYFKNVISRMISDIKNGKSFSDALAQYPKIFSSLYITMVNAGEESGNLQEMLVNVSLYQKRQEEIIRKVRMALVYPALMALVGLATVYFILTVVLPKMASLFDTIGDSLPLPTAILLQISHFLSSNWIWILLFIAVSIIIFVRTNSSEKARFVRGRFLLHLPVLGNIVLLSELARFSRTMVLLLKSGTAITRALEIAIPILSNDLIKAHLLKCQNDLTLGGSFGESLKESKEIPPMMGHLIAVGEEAGNLNDVLGEIAETYEQETDESIKAMTTLLEPVMILGVGSIVGFIVFAMLLPIFEVNVFAH